MQFGDGDQSIGPSFHFLHFLVSMNLSFALKDLANVAIFTIAFSKRLP